MRFFRGIAVPAAEAESVISTISRDGLDRDRGRLMIWEPPADPKRLFEKHDLSIDDTQKRLEGGPVAICACGDDASAALYAFERNMYEKDDTPILIEIEAKPADVAVDGRDFLYTAFQLGSAEKTSDALEGLFGPRVLRYAVAGWDSKDRVKSIPMCDLAIHDMDVLVHHYKNKRVIAGRYSTKFRNAFKIKLPIEPASIVRVWTPTTFSELPPADVSLSDVVLTHEELTLANIFE